MAVRAYLAHSIPGRLRIRVPSRTRDTAFFMGAVRKFADHPDVDEIKVNPATGSLLIVHRGGEEALRRFAEAEGLFTVEQPKATAVAAFEKCTPLLGYDLSPSEEEALLSTTIAALLGLSAYQARRGKFLPAGMTLVSSAIQLFSVLRDRKLRAGT